MDYEYRDILKQPLEAEELKELASRGGLPVEEMLNPKSAGFKKLGLDIGRIGSEEAARLIYENPKIMRRPLLTDGTNLVVGFNADQYAGMTT